MVMYLHKGILSAIKMSYLQLHARSRMNLINIMLKKRDHSQQSTYSAIPFIRSMKIGKTNVGYQASGCDRRRAREVVKYASNVVCASFLGVSGL